MQRASGSLASVAVRAAIAGLLLPALAAAQTGVTQLQPSGNGITRVGTRGANFLSIGVGARALALGGAAAASGNDLSSLYWNPAGLADLTSVTAFASVEQMYGSSGLKNTFVGAGLPLFGGALGVSLNGFTSGDIERTTEAYPEGGDPTFGAVVSWNAMSIGLTYARPFTDRLAFGITAKGVHEGMQFVSATYVGADLGLRFRSGLFGSTLGIAVANLGNTARMDGPAVQRRLAPLATDPQFPSRRTIDTRLQTDRLQLPTALRITVQTDLLGAPEALFGTQGLGGGRLSLFSDVTDAIDTQTMPALALEYGFRDRVFVRGGKRFMRDERPTNPRITGLSVGGGLALPIANRRFLLDYAYRNFGDLGGNQVFSFQFGY